MNETVRTEVEARGPEDLSDRPHLSFDLHRQVPTPVPLGKLRWRRTTWPSSDAWESLLGECARRCTPEHRNPPLSICSRSHQCVCVRARAGLCEASVGRTGMYGCVLVGASLFIVYRLSLRLLLCVKVFGGFLVVFFFSHYFLYICLSF